mmetsp:Transcript_111591/g.315122  ORF Transcript_111591/g.315122 Transcript_111591/m.315122 type:complete len:213 (+) Transcript_111591:510-1148(+)
MRCAIGEHVHDRAAGGVVGLRDVAVSIRRHGEVQRRDPRLRLHAVQGDAGSCPAAKCHGVPADEVRSRWQFWLPEIRRDGSLPRGQWLERSGAAPGDHVRDGSPAVLADPRVSFTAAHRAARRVHWYAWRPLKRRLEIVRAHHLRVPVRESEHVNVEQYVKLTLLERHHPLAALRVVVVAEHDGRPARVKVPTFAEVGQVAFEPADVQELGG